MAERHCQFPTLDRVAIALDIIQNTVARITREKYGTFTSEDNKLPISNKTRSKKATVTNVDTFAADAIRNHIYNYYSQNELPTLLKLTKSLKDADLFTGSPTSQWRKLKNIIFKFKKVNKR